MSMKSRITEIVFTKEYSKKDFLGDYKTFDAFLEFSPEDEKQSQEDAFVNIINNENLTERSKQGMIFSLVEPLISDPKNIQKVGVRKAFRIAKLLSPKHKELKRFKKV